MTESDIKIFLLSAVAMSVGVWNITFFLGVFQTVFFEHIFFVWVVCTATLLGRFFLSPPSDDEKTLIGWRGRLVLLFPTLGVILRLFGGASSIEASIPSGLIWFLSVLIGVICLPYVLYILVVVTTPDLINLKDKKLFYALVGIVLFVGIIGYFVGKHNDLFLTCYDFQVSGNDLPVRCKK